MTNLPRSPLLPGTSNGASSRLASALAERRNWSITDSASWAVGLGVSFGVTPVVEPLGRSSAFFAAHGISLPAGLLVIALSICAVWLASYAALKGLSVIASPLIWDLVTSTALGALAWFWAYGLIGPRILDGRSVAAPALLALPVGIVIAFLSRRFRAGNPLLIITSLMVLSFLLVQGLRDGAYATESPVRASPKHDVIWIIADELSYPLLIGDDGEVRPQFPHLRALQRQATTYTQALAPANMTDSALPALFRGEGDARQAGSIDKATRVGVLGTLDTDVKIIDTPMVLPASTQFNCRFGSPVQRAIQLAVDLAALAGKATTWWPLQQWLPSTQDKWAYFWSPTPAYGPECLISAMQMSANSDAKLVGLWHTLSTHFPWSVDDQGLRMFQTGGWRGVHDSVPTGERRTGAGTRALQDLQKRLYANAAQEFDRQVGEVLDTLATEGRLADALIVVTADHGVAFTLDGDPRMGENADGGRSFWTQVAHVPLIVKYPQQAQPEKVKELRSTTQIASTILATNGIEPNPAMEPPLSQAPSTRARVVKLTMGRDLAATYPLAPVDSSGVWSAQDFDYLDLPQPFAVGIDQARIGGPVSPGTRPQPATYTAYSAESPWQLLDIDRPENACGPTEVGFVADDQGIIVGSVLWEGTDATRGWAIVPVSSEYQFWCPD